MTTALRTRRPAAAAVLSLVAGIVAAAPAQAAPHRSAVQPAAPATTSVAAVPLAAVPLAAVPLAAPAAGGVLRRGDRGAAVLALQRRLTALGYWLGTPDGRFGDLTHQAVLALQKADRQRRDGVVGPATRRALARGIVPRASTRTGRAVEIDLARQVLLVVRDGKVLMVLNTSTGTGRAYTSPSGRRAVATTPKGTFEVTWSYDGWRTAELGRLYRPRYFHPRGIAVHGAASVPAYPASHGCARVSVPAMDLLWKRGAMPIGSRVVVR